MKLSSKFLIGAVLILGGCATNPPLNEYTLARTALEAAKDQEAARYAPSYFHQAEENFREAEVQFREHEYRDSEENFIKAREFAEKAENSARLQKYKSGEVTP